MIDVTQQPQTAGAITSAFAHFDHLATDTPDYEKIREVADSMVPFGVHVGVRITEVGPERAVVEIPDLDHMTNHMGTVHAGALFLAADIAGASAFVGAMVPRLPQVQRLVLRDGRNAFLKPALGRIRAIATVDDRTISSIVSRNVEEKFDLDGKAMLYDDNDVLVAKFYFDYVCNVTSS
jgi:acyl-coenzyme A thioesterase PaaI-like protein